MANSKYYQIKDIYPYLKHPEKYTGTRPITMRSSWESKYVLKYLDLNKNIEEWKSEVPITYTLASDGKKHKYFIDFWFKARTKNNTVEEFLIEIKPYAESLDTPPPKPKRMTKSFQYKLETYIKNQSKWRQTKLLVEEAKQKGRNIHFIILTEVDCPFFLK